jgi:hypothetical protein
MSGMEGAIDRIAAATRFSGVVRVDRGGDVQLAKAYGLAHRGLQIANTLDTQFEIASGVKGMTAPTVVSLVEEGACSRPRPVMSNITENAWPLADHLDEVLVHEPTTPDLLDELAAHGLRHRGGAIAGPELLVDVLEMGLHRVG